MKRRFSETCKDCPHICAISELLDELRAIHALLSKSSLHAEDALQAREIEESKRLAARHLKNFR